MSKIMLFLLLNAVLGNPLLAVLVLFLAWYAVDRVAFGLLPSPVRAWRRWSRTNRLRQLLLVNPHDRRARLELGDLLVARGRHAEALEVLRPNVEAGDDDAETLYFMGIACFGTGRADQGEVFLGAAAERDPKFRVGAIDLELGRGRLATGDTAGAREALERFCRTRHGTVEGKVLLACALDKSDAAAASEWRDRAWQEFVAAPRFQRRTDRLWAWRAKPSRPLLYAAALALALAVCSRWVLPELEASLDPRDESASAESYEPDAPIE